MLPSFYLTQRSSRVDPDAALAQWQESHTGPFTMSTTSPNHIAYTRLANVQMDPAAGPNTPHIEMCPLVSLRCVFTFANVHAELLGVHPVRTEEDYWRGGLTEPS